MNPDVLIVGASISGCTLAVALRKQGLNVVLVEQTPGPRRIFKGEYLQPAVLRTLEKVGFSDLFNVASSSEVRTLHFRDLGARGEVVSDFEIAYPDPHVGRSISYFDLISGLQREARKALGENLWLGTKIEPANPGPNFLESPQFLCQNPQLGSVTINPRFVVGCDGRHSVVRKWMGGKAGSRNGKVVLGTEEEFIFGFEVGAPARQESRYEIIRTYGEGTLSAFALGRNAQRVYYSSPANKEGEKNFRQVLHQMEPLLGMPRTDDSLRVSGYPANTEWFGPAFKNRFLLAGDALAVTTPYGGQGMTAAMEHVWYLANSFDWLCKSPAHYKLNAAAYAQHATKVHDRICLLNFGLYYSFFSPSPIFKVSTKKLTAAWDRDAELKSKVIGLMAGLDVGEPDILELLTFKRVAPLLHKVPYSFHMRWA